MRASLVVLVVLTVTAATAGAMPASTSLRITFWADSSLPTQSTTWTLRCDPPGGSLARPVQACRKLAAGGVKVFAPTPANTACTEIYGGPQKARILGTVGGRRVRATFSRTNGCEISRWQRVSPWLVPPGGVS
jgi:hypothetical protein